MMNPISTHVRAFYPADPSGIVPGGVDTFLRGIIKYAPDDIQFSLVGMTTDNVARPCGRWTRCQIGNREYDFFPVVQVGDAGQRTRIPLSLRYTAGVVFYLSDLIKEFDVYEFHRIEPALLFMSSQRPKNAFFHQDMAVIRSDKADIIWRKMPNVYFAIERLIVKSLSSAWCVRQDGVNAMRQRYPDQSERINFVPTWVDTEVFSPPDDIRKSQLRNQYVEELGIDTHSLWVVSVGRLDSQKDPSLMLAAFDYLVKKGILLTWLVIGDGVLREGLQRQVCEAGLSAQVRFLGLKSPGDIADLLRASDVFALSSAYEGMPMALLEALGSGLPVATTDVGEVRRVVKPGVNGAIAADRSVESFVACLSDVIAHVDQYKGEAAVQAIQDFQPKKVLATVFDNYRLLGRRARESRARTNKIT